jgi:hypothetical protein
MESNRTGVKQFAQVSETSGSRTWSRNTIWMAYIPPHLLKPLEKRWHRIQGDAGAAPTLDYPINSGCLHPGNHTRQAECAGRGHVVSLPYPVNAEDIYKEAA